MTQLGQLVLGGNRLTGAIPPELGSIGPTLTTLQLSGPNPLPTGIGLSGSIPPQLGNLTGLQQLWLNGNRLTGTIPTRLGRLTNLIGLHLDKNQLSGSIPTQLGALSNLTDLQLQDNQLTGPLPSQLGGLTQLNKIYLLRNAGFSGCVPLPLRRVRYHHFDWLGLPDCAADAPDTPVTPLPTFTLTATAGPGGTVDPAGATTHDEAAEVTLTASWNDATHTFAGWGGDCSGTATTCVLTMYTGKTVTASFTALAADRCATATNADCIRAVYLGAPDDYPQVQDIPADLLLSPDANGRYEVERGVQVTVVTAAPLPASYTRFYLQQDPVEQPWPVSSSQLIPPVGTTYTFTPSTDPAAADLITFDLHAARPWPFQRPGLKPELGDVIVRTTFAIPSPPLTLELASSRQLCTANTLTELSWSITGGRPPYTLSIDGETVAANAESHRANCGPIPTDPFTGDPIPESRKRWTATVSDSQEPSASTRQRIEIELVEPLAPPPLVWMSAFGTQIAIAWTETEEHRAAVWYGKGGVYAIRFRLEDTIAWTYAKHHTGPVAWIELPAGDMTVQMAVLRAPIEQATPQALRWSENHRIARVEEPANATAVATHDTVTVSWDRQPLTGKHADVTITAMDARASALARNFYEDPDDPSTRFSFTFEHLPPDSDYEVTITYGSLGIAAISRTLEVRTQEAPENWQPLPSGPHNLRATAGHRWITVQWDPPFDGAEPSYLVQIIDESDGTQIDSKATKQTEWTSYGSFRPVWPSTEYRISVLHTAIPEVEAQITITTPEPGDSRADRTRAPRQEPTDPWEEIWAFRFQPIWPVAIDAKYDMIDDPFHWRIRAHPPRYHAGLDIGAHYDGTVNAPDWSRAMAIKEAASSVVAVESGYLRVYNNNQITQNIVYYCPLAIGGLLNQILAFSQDRFQQQFQQQGTQLGCGENTFVGSSSGRTAIVIHDGGPGRRYVTKYAHLKEGSIPKDLRRALAVDPSCVDLPDRTEPCKIDAAKQIYVERGDKIGEVGNSYGLDHDGNPNEDGFPDVHLHFEIRKFDGAPEHKWYSPKSTKFCSAVPPSHCGWTATRWLESVEDVERYLPPLPASGVPLDPGGSWDIEVTNVRDTNPERHVIELTAVRVGSATLSADVESAFWRPVFYSRYDRQTPRTSAPGIAGTRSGVDRYFVASSCDEDRPSPIDEPVTGDPGVDAHGDPAPAGELPREEAVIELGLGDSCTVDVLTGNRSYAAPRRNPDTGRWFVPREDIELRDPVATLTWIAELSPGAGVIRAGQSLDGHGFDFFSFVAYRDQTYQFCAYPAGNSDCIVTGASSVATMELWGSAGQIAADSGTAELAWTPGPDDAAEQTVVLMVRRRDRVGDAGVADHPYTLTYSFPPPPPTDLSVTNRTAFSITLTWTPSPGASTYGVKHTIGSECDGEPTDRTTGASYTFRRLSGDTQYTLCVRAQRGGAQSDSARSDAARSVGQAEVRSRWAPATARTLATPSPGAPAMPSGLTVTEVTDTSAMLHWDGVTGATGYKTRRDGVTSPLQPVGRVNSHPFGGLTARTAHKLEVAASNSSGNSRFASLTLLLPPTGLTPTPTQDSITLSWTALANLTYEVKLGAGSAAPAENPSSHPFRSLASNTTYTLYVRAGNSQGPSAWASTTARTNAPPVIVVIVVTCPEGQERFNGRCRPTIPDPYVSVQKVGLTTVATEWRLFADGVPGAGTPNPPGTCYWILYQKDRYALAEFQTSYRWNGSQWVLDPATTMQIGLETDYIYTDWYATTTRFDTICPRSGDGARGASAPAPPPAGARPPGDYVVASDGAWYRYTIPNGANVTLQLRTVDERAELAFSLPSGAEVAVVPSQLASDPPETDDPTLASIVRSFRLEDDPARLPPGAENRTCAEAPSRDDAGALSLDLDAQWCTIVRGGGATTLMLGTDQLALSLSADHVWLVLAAPQSRSIEAAGIWIVDKQSRSHLILDPATGAELSRHIPEGNTELPALFDAMIPAAPADDGS